MKPKNNTRQGGSEAGYHASTPTRNSGTPAETSEFNLSEKIPIWFYALIIGIAMLGIILASLIVLIIVEVAKYVTS